MTDVLGHVECRNAWQAATASGRMHHAWLLQGPRGIGKATLAIEFAQGLLASDGGSVGSGVDPESHPDLRIVRCPVDDKGKVKTEIPVNSIRALNRFFTLKSAMGGWRVAVIDALDTLNRNGANALLKTLEEPPSRCMLLLISHGNKTVLPTIRSRCRSVRLKRLSDTDSLAVLASQGLSKGDAGDANALAPGRPGEAMRLFSREAVDAAETARQSLGRISNRSNEQVKKLITGGSKSDETFEATMSALVLSLSERATSASSSIAGARYADAAASVQRLSQECSDLKMDRAQALALAAGQLQIALAYSGGR